MTMEMNGNRGVNYNVSPPLPPVPSAMPNSSNLHNSAVLERVLFQLHLRTCRIGLGLSASTRRLLEHFFLVVAIAGFGALVLLHRNFVLRQGTLNCASTCLTSLPKWDPSADLYQVHILSEPTLPASGSFVCVQQSATTSSQDKKNQMQSSNSSIPSCTSFLEDLNMESLPPIAYSFSSTQAFLLLPANHSWIDSLRIQHIVLSPQDPYCFGEPFLQALVRHFVGYDTVIVNSFLAHLRQQKQQQDTKSKDVNPLDSGVGYIRHARTGKVKEIRLIASMMLPSKTEHKMVERSSRKENSALHTRSVSEKQMTVFATAKAAVQSMQAPGWSKVVVVFQTTMLFFFCTTLVSFTLRETQERMLEFTQELSRRVSINMPRVDLVLHHVIHNIVFVPIMVGMMFFLIEFYGGDRFLAFVIMSMFWCVEVYSVVSLRSYQGIAFFPPMFFLLFCLFHIYYFANPYGFIYVALLVMGCTMSHSVVFFWHRYELPAVALGRVTVDHPRNLHFETHSNGVHPIPVTSDGTVQGSSPLREHPNLTDRSYSPLTTPVAPDPPSPPAIRLAHPPPSILEPTPPTSNVPNSRTNGPLQVPVVRRSSSNNLNMSNSTNSSRRTSVLQFLGSGAPGDDDDDESYVYFMGGEVVLHPRPERLDPLPMEQVDPAHNSGTEEPIDGEDSPNQESNPLL
eukprot:Nitzschia sp. Nitz4//scaffold338_size18487//11739//13873//NITZ4_008789-RA/size18487-processed-gene-0.14-mRNA-1//-1//CDS//3329548338//1281//frame0